MKIWEIDFNDKRERKYVDNIGFEWILKGRSLKNLKNDDILSYYHIWDILELNFEEVVDWRKIPVDTKVLVKDDDKARWSRRYFAKYEDGKVYTWSRGATSFSTDYKDIKGWKYAKLFKEENNNEL